MWYAYRYNQRLPYSRRCVNLRGGLYCSLLRALVYPPLARVEARGVGGNGAASAVTDDDAILFFSGEAAFSQWWAALSRQRLGQHLGQ